MNTLIKSSVLGIMLVAGAATFAAADEAREKLAANFAEADANADEALTIDEFTRLIDLNAEDGIGRARMVQRGGRYETAFKRIDANGDGLIGSEELAALSQR
ncbi:MAG: hypothetical protein AAGF90_05325 [Pseudomonadota bacterium]